MIVASNNINEPTLLSLRQQGHQIDAFGVGTHLVTCQVLRDAVRRNRIHSLTFSKFLIVGARHVAGPAEPWLRLQARLPRRCASNQALAGHQISARSRFDLGAISAGAPPEPHQEVEKMTIPGVKASYRLYNSRGCPLLDIMQTVEGPPPQAGTRILCRHPFQARVIMHHASMKSSSDEFTVLPDEQETKRAYVAPARVDPLHSVVWDGGYVDDYKPPFVPLANLRAHVMEQAPIERLVSFHPHHASHPVAIEPAACGRWPRCARIICARSTRPHTKCRCHPSSMIGCTRAGSTSRPSPISPTTEIAPPKAEIAPVRRPGD